MSEVRPPYPPEFRQQMADLAAVKCRRRYVREEAR